MKLYKLTFWVLLAVIAISTQSCKTSRMEAIKTTELEGKWILKTMNGQDAKQLFLRKTPDIEFKTQEKQISGFSGCNRYFGAYTLDNNKFSAPNLAGTLMACPDMDNENTLNKLLSQSSDISMINGELVFSQKGKKVLTFERQKPLTASDLAGEWKLESLQGATANVYFKNRIPTLIFDFDKMRVNGNAGCNNYFGSFEQTAGHEIEIGMLGSTRMACPDAMEGENKYLKALPGKSTIEIVGNRMTLTRDGIHVASFSK